MVDIINFIRNLIFTPAETRKRKAPLEEFHITINPKVRRISTSQMSSFEDDWHSTASSIGSIKRRSSLHGPKSRPNWSKENDTVTIEDDDDVLEVSRPKHKLWLDLKSRRQQTTSTPNVLSAHRPSFQNGDDDVLFLKTTQSALEKKLDAKRQGFEYIKPFSNLTDNTKTKTVTNGVDHGLTSMDKDKKVMKKKPSVRSTIMDQSFRLDEKAKYKRLLQQAASSASSLRDSFSKYSTANRLFPFESSRGKKILDLVTKNQKPSTVIDLTSGKPKTQLSTKETIKKVLNDFDEPVTVKDSDSDVEILPTPPSPKPDIQVERVNTLKKVIDTAETVQGTWLKQLIETHKNHVSKLEREIRQQQEQRKKLGDVASEVAAQRLEEQVAKCLTIKEAVLPIHISEEFALPELTDEDERRIDVALSRRGNANEVLVSKFNLNITRRDIQTLAGLNWLNDEVINFYMNLIIERGKNSKWPKAYAMNTFFYPKLIKDGPVSLKRWTRRVDLFAHDIIAVPIHLGVHWCMAIIDFRNKVIQYYDSMGGSNRQCLEALLKYLQAEHLDKKRKEFDVDEWSLESVQDIPQQMNGSDCGMFSCTFAEFLTRNAKTTFSQENMPYLRRKMVLEILNGELLIN